MKSDWEQSRVIFTSSCIPEERNNKSTDDVSTARQVHRYWWSFVGERAYAEGTRWFRLSGNWGRLRTAGRFGLDTTTNSRQTPRHHLKEINAQDRDHEKDSQGGFLVSKLCSENPPNSPMGLGTGMTCVQSKGRLLSDQMTGWTFCMMLREMATMLHVSCRTATRLPAQSRDVHIKMWSSPQLRSCKAQGIYSQKRGCWLTLATSGWAQTGWAASARSSRGGTSCRWCSAASRPARGRRWCSWVGSWTLVCARQKKNNKKINVDLIVLTQLYWANLQKCNAVFTSQLSTKSF